MLSVLWIAIGLSAAEPSYFRDVRPVLQRQCQGCHQPNLKSSNLDLTTYEGLKTGGKHGSAVGLLVQYLTGEMKPEVPLGMRPCRSRSTCVRTWVAAGGKDDTPEEARETVSAGTPTVYSLPPVLTALAFSPDGKMLAVSGNREILLHTLDGSAPPQRLPGLSDSILSLAFSRDGSLLVAGGGTPARFGEIQFWDLPAAKLRRSVMLTADTRLRRIALSRCHSGGGRLHRQYRPHRRYGHRQGAE